MIFHEAWRGCGLIATLTLLISLISPSAAAIIGPEKFHLVTELLSVSEVTCNKTLQAYRTAWQNASSFADVAAKCNTHQECILGNSSENAKAYQAGASILLGLTPLLLSSSAPTISEMGLLGINRPLLTVLIALGTAALSPSRVLDYTNDNPADVLERPSLITSSCAEWLRVRPRRRYLISLCEYLILAGAVANIMYTSWTLGVSTIPNFQCQISYLPILWTVLPLAIYIIVLVGYAIIIRHRRPREMGSGFRGALGKRGWVTWIKAALGNEVTLSIAHSALPPEILENKIGSAFLYWLASVGGFIHVIVGTLFFSSLLFVQVSEAAFILIRYFLSVLFCRVILIWELEGLRYVNTKKDKLNNPEGEELDQFIEESS